MLRPSKCVFAAGLWLSLVALCLASSQAATGPTVRLEIVNASATEAMKCVAVLAHFFSRDYGPVGPGKALHINLEYQPGDSTLSVTNGAGQAMLVENLLCGSASNWDRDRSEVPLGTVRASGQPARISCLAPGRSGCRLVQGD